MSDVLLDYDPLSGTRITMSYKHDSDDLVIKTEQDCTDIIEYNKRMVIEADHTQQIKNDWIKYASVPYVVIDKWRREHGINFMTRDPDEWKKVMMMINSSDWSGVKTSKIHHDR
jgi:hypothetical protein